MSCADERIVNVIKRAVEWFDFDESEDTALSLARVVLAQLRGKGYEVVPEGFTADANADVCVIHLAPRAAEEDRRVCWNYDGKDDCRFTTTHPAVTS